MSAALNAMAESWWSWMFPIMWQTALLAGFVWLVDFGLRRRGWPQVRYALWGLVFLRLILPPDFALPTSVSARIIAAGQSATARAANEPQEPVESARPAESLARPADDSGGAYKPGDTYESSVPYGIHEANAATAIPPAPAETMAQPRTALPWKTWAMLSWAGITGLLFAWLASRMTRLRRIANRAGAAPDFVNAALREQAARLGFNERRLPRIAMTDELPGPAICGIFRPVLFLPSSIVSQEPLAHVLLHELAHLKRRDLLVNGMQTILHIVYWFNPVVWLAGRRLRHLREVCCDATVANFLRERTDDYCRTLVEAADRTPTAQAGPALGLLGMFENKSRLRQRLEHLNGAPWKHRRLKIAAAFATALVVIGCVAPMGRITEKEPAQPTDSKGEWGKAVGGWQLRLRSEDAEAWKEGEPRSLKLDAHNSGSVGVGPHMAHQVLEVDGISYVWKGLPIMGGGGYMRGSGRLTLDVPLSDSWQAEETGTPLALLVGQHSIRMKVPGLVSESDVVLPAFTNTVHVTVSPWKPDEELPWTKAVIGTQIRLRPVKRDYFSGETLKFMLDVRYVGQHYVEYSESAALNCQLEFDGKVDWGRTPVLPFKGKALRNGESVSFELNVPSSFVPEDGRRQPLVPGKHVVRARFMGIRDPRDDGIPLIMSNSAQVIIAAPDNTWDQTWHDGPRGLQVRAMAMKRVWTPNEMPSLRVQFRNGSTHPVICRWPSINGYLDEKQFVRLYVTSRDTSVEPGGILEDTIAWDKNWVLESDRKNQLDLTPGNHSLRISFFASSRVNDVQSDVLVTTRPVEIAIENPLPGIRVIREEPETITKKPPASLASGEETSSSATRAGKDESLITRGPNGLVAWVEDENATPEQKAEIDQLKAKLEADYRSKMPPINWAALKGNVEEVERLLAAGADMNSRGAGGETVLHDAVKSGSIQLVKMLLDRGAKPAAETASATRQTPMAVVIWERDDAEMVKLLVDKGADINRPCEGDSLPLIVATRRGRTQTAKYLIEQGAKVNVIQKDLGTPLMLAAANGDDGIVELLLAKGANVDVRRQDGRTAAWAAMVAQIAEPNVITLAPDDSKRDAAAAAKARTRTLKLIMDAGGDINAADNNGVTPLTYAVSSGIWAKEIKPKVELLLACGADLNAKEPPITPPLVAAVRKKNIDLVQFLIGKKADVNLVDSKLGFTPLHWAVTSGDLKMMQLLLENGAKPDEADPEGRTPLYSAASAGKLEAVKLLIQYGADPNAKDDEGFSPLDMAKASKDAAIIKILKEAAAKP